jgi:hypothetical protein
LFAAVDTRLAPEFLEQEMSNALRGKYKIKGKEKKTDKLVKLRLLTGEDYYIYVHLEIQDQLKDDFPERLYIYRSLISLRYMTQNIRFVLDYMLLSDEMENEFKVNTLSPIFSPQNTDSMVITRGERTLAEIYSTRLYGKSTEALLAEKDAEKEAERQNTIQALLSINFSPEKIADLLGYNLKYVQKIAKKATAKK